MVSNRHPGIAEAYKHRHPGIAAGDIRDRGMRPINDSCKVETSNDRTLSLRVLRALRG